MISRDFSKVDMTEELFKELTRTVDEAPPYMLKRDMCVVNRKFMLMKLNELHGGMPESLRQAAHIVLEEKVLRDQGRNEREEELAKARTEAQRIGEEAQKELRDAKAEAQRLITEAQQQAQQALADAHQQAQELIRLAQDEARRMNITARQDADKTRAEAQQQMREMIAKENIQRMAKVEADEILERAHREVSALHDDVFEYLDGVMGAIDGFMCETVKRVRTEQKELNNHRLNLNKQQ